MRQTVLIRLLLICIALPGVAVAQSQHDRGTFFLTSANSKDLFYVGLDEETGVAFKLARWMDKAGSGYILVLTDTMIRQAGASGYQYAGNKTWIQEEPGKMYLLFRDDTHDQPRRILLDSAGIKEANTNINNAYWWTAYSGMCKDINSSFDWYHHSFRDGFREWEMFDNKESDYRDFRTFADNRIRTLKDSILIAETARTRLTRNILNGISTIKYESLKDSISKLPVKYVGSSYFRTVVNEVVAKRPEVFFGLAEDLPGIKSELFTAVDPTRATIKTLKAVETNTPAKKEFFRERRNLTISLAGSLLLSASFLGYCIYAF